MTKNKKGGSSVLKKLALVSKGLKHKKCRHHRQPATDDLDTQRAVGIPPRVGKLAGQYTPADYAVICIHFVLDTR